MFSKVYVLFLLVVYLVHGGSCDSVPEDLLTDNQEQLEHWKQGNLIDSILNQLPFLGGSKENEEAASVSKNSQAGESVDKKASQIASPTVPFKSIVPSPSSFGSVSTEKMSISRSSNETMSKSVFRNSTELLGTPALKPTKVLNSTSIVFSKNVSSSRHLNTTNTTANSTTNVSLVTRVNEHASLFSHLVSSLNLSTTPLFISSSPAAHSSPLILDTAQKTISPFSTSFGNTRNTVSRVMGTNTKPSKSKSVSHASTVYQSSPTVGMPVLPDEKGYGGMIHVTYQTKFIIPALKPMMTG